MRPFEIRGFQAKPSEMAMPFQTRDAAACVARALRLCRTRPPPVSHAPSAGGGGRVCLAAERGFIQKRGFRINDLNGFAVRAPQTFPRGSLRPWPQI